MSTNPIEKQTASYDADSIKVLKGLDAVKKRPGMYIGDTDDGSGLHHMVFEVVDNAIDEALAGHCDKVLVEINKDGSVSVTDNGRGIPVDIHKEEGVSAVEVIMTQLHSGGKFDQNSYKVSGGLHGVGVSVVNALSRWMVVEVYKDGKEYNIRFEDGVAVKPLEMVGNTDKKGTKVSFMPSSETFSFVEFDFAKLEHRLRELAFLNSGVNIDIIDHRGDGANKVNLFYEGGIVEYVKYIDRSKNIITDIVAISGAEGLIEASVALCWNDSYNEHIACFTNNIRQRDGGTHLIGFKSAVTRVINDYIALNFKKDKDKLEVIGDDTREGMTAVLSVKMPDPKFSSQTKDKLVSSDVRRVVENIVAAKLTQWMEEKPSEAKEIMNKVFEAARARLAAKKAREATRAKSSQQISILSGKLADCSSRDPEKNELYIVEGDSAGGSAKSGRDRKYQAILPIRGKILNVERVRFDKIISSEMVGTIIHALGTGIGLEDFDIEKTKYHKIVIMADADVDGSHITTLLLTLFFRHLPQIIQKGYLYIAQPPLYKIKRGQKQLYIKDQAAMEEYLIKSVADDSVIEIGDGRVVSLSSEDMMENLRKLLEFVKSLKNISNEEHVPNDIVEQVVSCNDLYPAEIEKLIRKNIKNGHKYTYQIEVDEFFVNIKMTIRNVADEYKIDIHKKDFIFLKSSYNSLVEEFGTNSGIFVNGGDRRGFNSLSELANIVEFLGSNGLSIQRFKGLGEMNAEQLWDTTLNPENRVLLQVKIDDIEDTDQVFSMLMGSSVEQRREFIESNALNVQNLDI